MAISEEDRDAIMLIAEFVSISEYISSVLPPVTICTDGHCVSVHPSAWLSTGNKFSDIFMEFGLSFTVPCSCY